MIGSDRPYVARNYFLGVANGALFHMAWHGLLHATIVIPPFVDQLAGQGGVTPGRTKMMVGLVASLTTVGWLWPQLIFSNLIEPFERKKAFYVVSGLCRIAVFAFAPFGIFWFGSSRPLLLYWLIAVAFFLYSSFGGIGLLPFMDIASKSMPADMRGRFFGARAFWGSGLAVASGYFVTWILDPDRGPGYPNNYLVIFSAGWLIMSAAILLFFLVDEPVGRPRRVKITFMQQLRRGPKLLRRDRDFFRLFLTRILLGMSAISAPFYILFARQRMNVGEGATDVFIACQVVCAALAALASGRIGDRFGNKVLMIIGGMACFLAPVVALASRAFSGSGVVLFHRPLEVWVFAGVFALGGFAFSGTTIAGLNYLLDIAPERRRPTYLGVMYTALAPLTFMPVLGGVLVEWASYELVFVFSAVFGLLVLISACRLREPRAEAAAAAAAVTGIPLLRPARWLAGRLTLRR